MKPLRLRRASLCLLMASLLLLPARSALADSTTLAAKHGERGRVMLEAGKLSDAYKEISQAFRLDPDELQYQYWLIDILTGLKRHAELEATYRQILRREPNSPDIRSSYAHFLVRQQRYREAIVQYDEALKGVLDPEAHVHYGDALMGLKRPKEAVDQYLQAMRLDPESVDFALAYAGGLLRTKRYPEAVQEFERIISTFDGPPDAMLGRGDCLFAMKRPDEALAAYAQAIEKRPDHAASYAHMAAKLLVLKRYDEAIAQYEKAIALDAKNAAYQAGLKEAKSRSLHR